MDRTATWELTSLLMNVNRSAPAKPPPPENPTPALQKWELLALVLEHIAAALQRSRRQSITRTPSYILRQSTYYALPIHPTQAN